MKSIISLDMHAFPFPLLSMHLHGAPHKRMMREVLQRDREALTISAGRQLNIDLPIDFPVELEVAFVNPASPDLDHMIEAVFMMLDGKNGSLTGPSVLEDDRLIQGFRRVSKYYTQPKTKRDSERQE